MAKFGDLISGEQAVLIHFYIEGNPICERMHAVVKEVANHFGDSVRVVEINVNSNKEVVHALQITSIPDFMIYKNGEMLWRTQGVQTANALKNTLVDYVNA